jgi:hypothetical protein
LLAMYDEMERERSAKMVSDFGWWLIFLDFKEPPPIVFPPTAYYRQLKQKEPEQVYTCLDAITSQHIELYFRSAGASWLSDEPLFMWVFLVVLVDIFEGRSELMFFVSVNLVKGAFLNENF